MMELNELQWPDGLSVTPRERRVNSRFKVEYQSARAHLKKQIKLMQGRDVKITSTPDTSPVAVYFTSSGKSYCFACDKFKTKKANLRAIGLTIESLRAIKRHGSSEMMEQAFRGFEALPAPTEGGWRKIFGEGLSYSPSKEELKARYRRLAKDFHPDQGGNNDHWIMINEAYEQAKTELGF